MQYHLLAHSPSHTPLLVLLTWATHLSTHLYSLNAIPTSLPVYNVYIFFGLWRLSDGAQRYTATSLSLWVLPF